MHREENHLHKEKEIWKGKDICKQHVNKDLISKIYKEPIHLISKTWSYFKLGRGPV